MLLLSPPLSVCGVLDSAVTLQPVTLKQIKKNYVDVQNPTSVMLKIFKSFILREKLILNLSFQDTVTFKNSST